MGVAVTIEQHAVPIEVELGETILEAALRNGIPYPHGCRSGNCGACKSRVIEGEVELMAHSEYALTEAEQATGLILACRSVPWDPVTVAWLSQDEIAVHPHRRIECNVVGLDDLTHDIRRVGLRNPSDDPFLFSPGQYAELTFDGQPPRDYSMPNRPDEELLEFHIRRIDGGRASNFVYDSLQPGDAVQLEGPYGAAYWRDTHSGPILAVAGGSGLAPIKSIIETALGAGSRQPIHLMFGVRDEPDVYMAAHLDALAAGHANFDYTIVLSQPLGSTTRACGLVHQEMARRLDDFDGWKAYLAGPPPMVEATRAFLQGQGMRSEDIHDDAFHTEAEKADRLTQA